MNIANKNRHKINKTGPHKGTNTQIQPQEITPFVFNKSKIITQANADTPKFTETFLSVVIIFKV